LPGLLFLAVLAGVAVFAGFYGQVAVNQVFKFRHAAESQLATIQGVHALAVWFRVRFFGWSGSGLHVLPPYLRRVTQVNRVNYAGENVVQSASARLPQNRAGLLAGS
jgi:hypothetical protein